MPFGGISNKSAKAAHLAGFHAALTSTARPALSALGGSLRGCSEEERQARNLLRGSGKTITAGSVTNSVTGTTTTVTSTTKYVTSVTEVVTNHAENESRGQNETKARPNNPMIRQDQPVPGRLSHLNRLSHPVQTVQTVQTIQTIQTVQTVQTGHLDPLDAPLT